MGLFDGLLGDVVNNALGSALGNAGQGQDVLGLVAGLMQQNGGLAGLLDVLKSHGLGEQVASWVGTGANQAISADQLSAALGQGPLASLANQFGLDSQQLGGMLSQYLPEVVNQLTPEGRLPDNAASGDLLQGGLAALAGKLFN